MSEINPIDPVLSLSDIIPGDFEPFMPDFDSSAPAEAMLVGQSSLGTIEEQANLEALAFKKCSAYSEYFSDPKLKETAAKAAQHHKQHFEALQDYLVSRR